MDAKCNKCEGTKFSIKSREDKKFCYVICDNCGTVMGVLEEIDFKKHNDNVIKKHGFFERRINELEEDLNKIKKSNNEIFELVEWIASKVRE